MDGSSTLAATDAPRVVLAAAGDDVRAALGRWRPGPVRVLAPWALGSLGLGLAMLAAALVVSALSAPGAPFTPVFVDPTAGASEFVRILERNLLVLLLEVLVCFAAYLSTRSLPLHARHTRGLSRTVHARAASVTLGIVIALAIYAFAWQAWRLGHDLSSAAQGLHLARGALLARLSLHAVPELTAVFLPLGAALTLARRRRFDDLAGAAVLSGVAAIPVVALAAAIEVWATRALF